jgi:hypothetical protein
VKLLAILERVDPKTLGVEELLALAAVLATGLAALGTARPRTPRMNLAVGGDDANTAIAADVGDDTTGTEHAVEVDTALDEVDWWFKDNQPDSERIRQAWVETLMLTPDEIPEFNEWWRTRPGLSRGLKEK